jgi:hypothetical protein
MRPEMRPQDRVDDVIKQQKQNADLRFRWSAPL